MTIRSFTINHEISDRLETWLTQLPNFISFARIEGTITVQYDFTDAQVKDFKRALAKRMELDDDNPNIEEIKYYLKGVVQILINKGVITLQDVQNQFPELFN